MEKLNIGCGRHVLNGYINVDKIDHPGVIRLDMFQYPWPFDQNTFDEFICSHIVEHIPHEAKPSILTATSPAFLARWQELEHLDGFFAFFAEIWRTGVNGARVHVTAPHGFTYGAFQDPTHTRYLVPQTFSYLVPDPDSKDFDYNLPFKFAVGEIRFDKPEYITAERIGLWEKQVDWLWNQTQNMYVELEVVK